MNISANQLRPGTVIEHEGKLWQCLSMMHRTPGNLRAFIQARMRDVRGGLQKEFRFSSTETLSKVDLRQRGMQFLYVEGEFYTFMDLENYEQVQISKEMLGDNIYYLLPETQVQVTFYEESPIGVALPSSMEFLVTEAEPGMKSATASASFKNAVIETGLTVKVPQFIEAGERIIVKTESGEYFERAKNK